MAKDPAALFFIDKWMLATAEMKEDCAFWYLNLILHQFNLGDLPNDLEELANLARVRHSKFEHFKQVFEQVLKQKFEQNDKGRLEHPFAREILQARNMFKQKRSDAGKLSYVLRYFRRKYKVTKALEAFIKENINLDFDIKNEQMLKHVFEQISELYINVNVIVNTNEKEIGTVYKTSDLQKYFSESGQWAEKTCMALKITLPELKNSQSAFIALQEATTEVWPNQQAAIRHFVNWTKNELTKQKKPTNGTDAAEKAKRGIA